MQPTLPKSACHNGTTWCTNNKSAMGQYLLPYRYADGDSMRIKTEARREAILAAAAQEFGERGYEGASINGIVARTGGSKRTVYNYFSSKEELFVAAVMRGIDDLLATAYASLVVEDDIVLSLRRYGERYLAMRQTPAAIALTRLAYGESGRSEVGRLLYRRGKMPMIVKLGQFLADAMRAGKLSAVDPTEAALYLTALLDAVLVDQVVMGVREPASRHEIAEIVFRAVIAFIGVSPFPHLRQVTNDMLPI